MLSRMKGLLLLSVFTLTSQTVTSFNYVTKPVLKQNKSNKKVLNNSILKKSYTNRDLGLNQDNSAYQNDLYNEFEDYFNNYQRGTSNWNTQMLVNKINSFLNSHKSQIGFLKTSYNFDHLTNKESFFYGDFNATNGMYAQWAVNNYYQYLIKTQVIGLIMGRVMYDCLNNLFEYGPNDTLLITEIVNKWFDMVHSFFNNPGVTINFKQAENAKTQSFDNVWSLRKMLNDESKKRQVVRLISSGDKKQWDSFCSEWFDLFTFNIYESKPIYINQPDADFQTVYNWYKSRKAIDKSQYPKNWIKVLRGESDSDTNHYNFNVITQSLDQQITKSNQTYGVLSHINLIASFNTDDWSTKIERANWQCKTKSKFLFYRFFNKDLLQDQSQVMLLFSKHPTYQKAIYNSDQTVCEKIGYFQNVLTDQVQIEQMPIKIKQVPTTLPNAITSLRSTFKGNKSYHLNGISSWNTSNVVDLAETFKDANLNENLNGWNISSVTDMTATFQNARYFDNSLYTLNWGRHTYKLEYADYTFDNSGLKNTNLISWNAGNIKSHINFATRLDQPNTDPNWNGDKMTFRALNAASFQGVDLDEVKLDQKYYDTLLLKTNTTLVLSDPHLKSVKLEDGRELTVTNHTAKIDIVQNADIQDLVFNLTFDDTDKVGRFKIEVLFSGVPIFEELRNRYLGWIESNTPEAILKAVAAKNPMFDIIQVSVNILSNGSAWIIGKLGGKYYSQVVVFYKVEKK